MWLTLSLSACYYVIWWRPEQAETLSPWSIKNITNCNSEHLLSYALDLHRQPAPGILVCATPLHPYGFKQRPTWAPDRLQQAGAPGRGRWGCVLYLKGIGYLHSRGFNHKDWVAIGRVKIKSSSWLASWGVGGSWDQLLNKRWVVTCYMDIPLWKTSMQV